MESFVEPVELKRKSGIYYLFFFSFNFIFCWGSLRFFDESIDREGDTRQRTPNTHGENEIKKEK